MISVSRASTYLAPSISAWKVGAMNSPSWSIVGLRKTGAVSRMKSFQNCPGASSVSGGGVSRIVRSSKPCASSVPAKDSSTMKTTRWPRRRRTSPMPTQLLVGPNAPSGKKTIVAAGSLTLLNIRGRMDFGIGYFPTARRRRPRRARRLRRGARLRVAGLRRAHPHPGQPRVPLPRRRRAAAQVHGDARPLRRADRGRRGDHPAAGRQRHRPGDRARPDHHRQRGRLDRRPLRRALRVRRRRRLEPRGDGQPRHRPAHPDAPLRRAGRSDEGDLDRARGELPRRVRQLRPHLLRAEAGSSGRTRRCWSAASARP